MELVRRRRHAQLCCDVTGDVYDLLWVGGWQFLSATVLFDHPWQPSSIYFSCQSVVTVQLMFMGLTSSPQVRHQGLFKAVMSH